MILEIPKPPEGKKGWPWTEETSISEIDQTKNWPKISIVTPSFNQGQFIEETIRSVLLQCYPNLEYIIIDGNSCDETLEIIKKYAPHITYWESKKDEGQSHAINKGIKHCSGEVFNWLNSDDILQKGALYEVATHFMENIDILTSDCDVQDFISDTVYTLSSDFPKKIEDFFPPGLRIIRQSSTFLKLEIINQIGGVNQNLNYTMDFDLHIRYCLFIGNYKLKKTNLTLSMIKFHTASKTNEGWAPFLKEIKYIGETILVELPTNKRNSIMKFLQTEAYSTIKEKFMYEKTNWTGFFFWLIKNPSFILKRATWGAFVFRLKHRK